MNFRVFRLALLLSGLPFLSGCFTYETLNAVKYPNPRVLQDRAHVEKAAVSKDDQLLIFLKGSISNSPSGSLFTLVIPLKQIETYAGRRGPADTNEIRRGIEWNVQRNLLHAGWLEESSNDVEVVPLGPLISPQYTFPDGFAGEIPESAKLLPNSTRTLYQVGLDDYLEFVYIDASDKRAYTDLQVVPGLFYPKKAPGYYFLLPITVPLDIATSPIQVPLFIIGIVYIGHYGIGC